jgi:hypothetical protein
MAVVAEQIGDALAQARFIFDHQDTHADIVACGRGPRVRPA